MKQAIASVFFVLLMGVATLKLFLWVAHGIQIIIDWSPTSDAAGYYKEHMYSLGLSSAVLFLIADWVNRNFPKV